ncbi:hypothetical protein BBJ29_002899 [Phytophthora kernoviae]|uniref:WW domain-containing protein n=1 Tax=Phytophthora kernoviae TaxID=325452 RepID=A0A3F2RSL5_9STRA|nr:hypothetical protein BBJ29_002899 [Phytophthora kernoviae]RLN63487.1 hypothetical protein BBP00_00004130 [Phytophthora kernoviae]
MRSATARAVATACSQRGGAAILTTRGLGASSISSERTLLQSRVLMARFASTANASEPHTPRENTRKFAWAETDIAPPSPGRNFMGRSANFDVTKRQDQFQRWEWLLKLLGFLNEDDRLFRHSTAVFQSCINLTAQPEFYHALGLPRSFRAQQALLMAHVWLVHRRLTLEGEQGKIIQELMFDRLWEETVVRIRYRDISEMTVNKHLAQVQQVCFNACIAYDKGLKSGSNMFQNAVAEYLLEDMTPEGLRVAGVMADYMKRELKNLERVDAKYIMEGTIPWGPLPVTNVKKVDLPDDDDDVVLIGQRFGNWRSALDNRGKLYYWNLTTRYSVWDRPTGDQLRDDK